MSTKQVLISYDEKKRVFSLPLNENILVWLTEEFKKEFGLSPNACITFQRYDSSWDEYIDICDGVEIQHKDKLKAVISKALIDKVNTEASAGNGFLQSSIEISDDEVAVHRKRKPAEVPSDSDSDIETMQSSDTMTSIDDVAAEVNCPVTDNVQAVANTTVTKKKLVVKTEDDKIPLPDPFPLPKHYPVELEEALANGKLSIVQKQSFFTHVASSMLRYKLYPDREDYICVARSVVQKYPFLKQQTGRPYDPIVRTLVDRFKEFRRKKKPRKSIVLEGSSQKSGSSIKKSPGIMKPMSSPQPPPGEDDVSFERHIKVLQVQYGKSNRNSHIVTELQNRTFAMRRNKILSENMYLDSIFKMFPFLQEAEELMIEMERIVGQDDLCATSREVWKTLNAQVLQQAHIEAPHNVRVATILKGLKDTEQSSAVTLTLSCLMLPDTRCKVDPEKIIYFTKGCENVTEVAKNVQNLAP